MGGSSVDEVDDFGDLVLGLGDFELAGFGDTASFLVVRSAGTGDVLQYGDILGSLFCMLNNASRDRGDKLAMKLGEFLPY